MLEYISVLVRGAVQCLPRIVAIGLRPILLFASVLTHCIPSVHALDRGDEESCESGRVGFAPWPTVNGDDYPPVQRRGRRLVSCGCNLAVVSSWLFLSARRVNRF